MKFEVDNKEFVEFLKSSTIKGIINTITIDVGETIVSKGIDNVALVENCSRFSNATIHEPGTFSFEPLEAIGRISSLGERITVELDDDKLMIYSGKRDKTIETLPDYEPKYPIAFELGETLLPDTNKIQFDAEAVISSPPKVADDITLVFEDSVLVMNMGEKDKYSFTKVISEDAKGEVSVKLDGATFSKVCDALGKGDITIYANDSIAYLYARREWGDIGYLIVSLE